LLIANISKTVKYADGRVR